MAIFHFSHYMSMETLRILPWRRKHTCNGNGNAKHCFCRGKYYEHFCKLTASSSLCLLRRYVFLNYFYSFVLAFGCSGNKSNSVAKRHMFGRKLLMEHLFKMVVKISAMSWKNTYFHFSHYKTMETLSCHCDKSTRAMAIKTHFCRS